MFRSKLYLEYLECARPLHGVSLLMRQLFGLPLQSFDALLIFSREAAFCVFLR